MPENKKVEKIDESTFYVVVTRPQTDFKSQIDVNACKAMIAEHLAAASPEALDALVQKTKEAHQKGVTDMVATIKAAADAGVTDAVQAVADLGV